MNITASQVQSLRNRTSLPMMDCKQALVETNGDETAAIDVLKKKFAKEMDEWLERETACGRIGMFMPPEDLVDEGDGLVSISRGMGALVELRCETDFVANNETFIELANNIAMEESSDSSILPDAHAKRLSDLMRDAFGKLHEKIEIKATKIITDPISGYLHHNGRVGAMISISSALARINDKTKDICRQICMHIASSASLMSLTVDDLDPKLVQKVRTEFEAEVPANKPQHIYDKIVDGKMNKWYSERVLVMQTFALDETKTVGDLCKEHGFFINDYIKLEIGRPARSTNDLL